MKDGVIAETALTPSRSTRLAEGDGLAGGDLADMGQHRHPAGRGRDAGLGQPHLLLDRQRVELAIGAGAEHAIPGCGLTVDLAAQRRVVDGLVPVERGDDGDEGTGDHVSSCLARPVQ